MGFLKHTLLEQEIIKDEIEIDEKLEAAGIEDENSIIQALIFEKKVFKTKEGVLDWVRSHCFFVDESIEETDKTYIVRQIDPIEFDLDSMKVVEIRDGIFARVGAIDISDCCEPICFGDKKDESIKFDETLPAIIEIAKVIEGHHARFGDVKITEEDLMSFKRNFDDKVTGVDLMIDYKHDADEAAGWFRSVYMSFDNQTLLGEIKWTPKGAQALSDKEFRYFSPEFHKNFQHPHTNEIHGPTLLGGALVNRPFLRMEAIVAMSDKNNNKDEVISMETIKLSDHNAKMAEKENELTKVKLSEQTAINTIAGIKGENTKLSDENKELKDKLEKKEKEDKHNLLFSDGKISKAQLDALNSGKDLYEVLALSEKMTTKPKGKVVKDGDTVVLSEEETEECVKLGLTTEEYAKYNT